MSTLSSRLGFLKPSQSDPAHLANSISELEDAVDATAQWSAGTYALRPTSTSGSPGVAGRFYYATDVGDLFVDVGTGWRYASKKLGEVFAFPGPVTAAMVDDGLFLADGSLAAKVGKYAALFALIGHAYNGGADPGGGNFRLPDLRGRAPVGEDGGAARLTGPDALGAAGGEERHALTTAELAEHSHPLDPSGAAWWVPKSEVVPDEAAFASGADGRTMDVGGGGHVNAMQESDTTGDGTAHNNMQPYQIVNWVIRAA